MQQIVDLQNSPDFQKLNVALLSVSSDSAAEQAQGKQEYGIDQTPMLVDAGREVSASYDILRFALPSGEPSHTFILVNKEGQVAWIKDYGAPDNPNRTMYVPVDELVREIRTHLQ